MADFLWGTCALIAFSLTLTCFYGGIMSAVRFQWGLCFWNNLMFGFFGAVAFNSFTQMTSG